MAIEFKDYYKILGVAKAASEDDIRKAFRKLARIYHPDVAKNKTQAEEKFKEINEAYEVLGDSAKRKKYDELGPNWNQPQGGFRPPPGFGQGRARGRTQGPDGAEFEFNGTGFSDFFEQLFGSRGSGGFRRAGGFTQEKATQQGQDVEADLLVTLEEAAQGSIRPITLRRAVPCPTCQGTGEVKGRPCSTCQGASQTERTDTYKVKIPAGVREGQSLRVPGQGEPGVGKGPAGDLYLRVRFAKHPDLRVEGGDLYFELDIAPWEAVLGAQVSIPTLQGGVDIKIPPGTQNGAKLRVRGKGLPSRDGTSGDLFVVTGIKVPIVIDDRQRALWTQLAEQSNFRPRD